MTTRVYLLLIVLLIRLDLKPSNILAFVVLLSAAAHVMIFQDGLWQDVMWLSAIVSVGIPLVLYRYMKIKESKKSRRSERYAEI